MATAPKLVRLVCMYLREQFANKRFMYLVERPIHRSGEKGVGLTQSASKVWLCLADMFVVRRTRLHVYSKKMKVNGHRRRQSCWLLIRSTVLDIGPNRGWMEVWLDLKQVQTIFRVNA